MGTTENGTATAAPEDAPATTTTALSLLQPLATPAKMIEAQDKTRRWIKEALTEGAKPGTGDYSLVPGSEDKVGLWQSGAEKIVNGHLCMFGAVRIMEREINHDRINRYTKRKVTEWKTLPNGKRKPVAFEEVSGESYGLYRYVMSISIVNRSTGEVVGEGVGSASTMESKYIDRPRDVENTIVKIATKRAKVDATLTTFALHGTFANAEELADDEDEREPGEESEGAPVKSKAKPAGNGGAKSCPKCKGPMWDNRAKKASGEFKSNRPDFSCKKAGADKECDGAIWPPKEREPSQDELRELEDEGSLAL